MTENLTITTEDELALEARIDGPADGKAVVVFCHPHPQMGGTMNAPLLEALAETLVERGWVVLRFNFRGIGSSEGVTGTGIEELQDARAAFEEARRRHPDLPIALAGWSFGAAVAVKIAGEHPELLACVGIAPSVTAKPDVTAGLPDPSEVHLPFPTLFVTGANDDLTPASDARAWVESAGGRMVEMAGANHFFWGKYPKLASIVADHLDAALEER